MTIESVINLVSTGHQCSVNRRQPPKYLMKGVTTKYHQCDHFALSSMINNVNFATTIKIVVNTFDMGHQCSVNRRQPNMSLRALESQPIGKFDTQAQIIGRDTSPSINL